MTLWMCCFMYGWGYTLDNILGIKLLGWRITVFVVLMDSATWPFSAVMPIYSPTSSMWGGSFHPVSLPQLVSLKSSSPHNNSQGSLLSPTRKRWADLPAGDQWAQMRMRWGLVQAFMVSRALPSYSRRSLGANSQCDFTPSIQHPRLSEDSP